MNIAEKNTTHSVDRGTENAMNKLLALTAIGEAALGLVLLVHPPVVVRLLFGAEIPGAGMVMSRIAGISLIALGIASWPGSDSAKAFWGMLTYSVLVTLYLAYLGIEGTWSGGLLWPTVALHGVLTLLLVRSWHKERQTTA
jgi:hypothetical protein